MQWFSRIVSVLSMIVVAFISAAPAFAAAKSLCPKGSEALCNIKLDQGGGIVGTIMVFLFIIAILTSLFFLIFGAVRYITAAGDQAKTAQARAHIIASIVGLIIALLAFFIVNIVVTFFTGAGLSGLSVPKL